MAEYAIPAECKTLESLKREVEGTGKRFQIASHGAPLFKGEPVPAAHALSVGAEWDPDKEAYTRAMLRGHRLDGSVWWEHPLSECNLGATVRAWRID